jgi:hypothetical protein
MRSGTPFEEEEDVCPSSTTSTVLKICDGFGNILSGIPSTKTFDAALFILGVDKTPLGTQNASLLSSSGAVVPDRDANGTDTEEGNSIVVLLASVVKTIVVKERTQRKERRKRKKRIFVVVFKASYSFFSVSLFLAHAKSARY